MDDHKVSFYLAFQSTLPVRGGTKGTNEMALIIDISIHPPRAGRDPSPMTILPTIISISIHPPRAGRDRLQIWSGFLRSISIHPPRAGRDLPPVDVPFSLIISIHPPRAGRDGMAALSKAGEMHFNPPSPCGEGQNNVDMLIDSITFQSTLPVRGGTPFPIDLLAQVRISIHPPRAGRDRGRVACHGLHTHFNPPSPCGEGHGVRWRNG